MNEVTMMLSHPLCSQGAVRSHGASMATNCNMVGTEKGRNQVMKRIENRPW